MTWTGQSFSVGQVLTAAQMNNLQADITALANGDSGAPAIQKGALALTGTILGTDLTNYDTGSYIVDNQKTDTDIVAPVSYTKHLEFKIGRAGTLNVRIGLVGNSGNSSGNFYGKIYVNGVAVGTERSMNISSTTWSYWNESISVSAGDLIQLYVYSVAGGSPVATAYLALMTGTPVDEVGKLYTLTKEG